MDITEKSVKGKYNMFQKLLLNLQNCGKNGTKMLGKRQRYKIYKMRMSIILSLQMYIQ